MPQRAELFFDVGSPYRGVDAADNAGLLRRPRCKTASWLALEVLTRYKDVWKLDLVLRPTLLGGVFKAVNNGPPAMTVPARAPHMMRDTARCAAHFGVPIAGAPANFGAGFSTTPAMRLLAAAAEQWGGDSERLVALARALYAYSWGRLGAGKEVNFDAALLTEACDKAGLNVAEANALVAASAADEAKAALRATTDEAVALGAYGVPWIVVRPPLRRAPPRGAGKPGEPMCFFGSDRFEQIAFLLGERWDGPRGPALAKL